MCMNHLLHLFNFLIWYCTWFQFIERYFHKLGFCVAFLLSCICLPEWQYEVCNYVFSCSCRIFSDPGIVKIFSWDPIPDLCVELINTCFICNSCCSIFFSWIPPTLLYSFPRKFTVILRRMNAFFSNKLQI